MSDELGTTPAQAGGTEAEQPWGTPVAAPPPTYAPPPAASSGLSDSAAGALAYVTFIPAVIFLLIEPYKDKPFVKFHCIQSIGLSIVWFVLHFFWIIPFLGWAIALVGYLVLFIVWIVCVLKASQGGSFKLPIIGKFAAEQSGHNV